MRYGLTLVFLFLTVSTSSVAWPQPSNGEKPVIQLDDSFKSWSYFRNYVPVKRDYGMEIGGMWEQTNLYWVGANTGFHIGRCMYSESQTCQQYFDVIGGVGGREGLTVGLALASLRWQFISFPNRYSPFARVFTGVASIRDNERDRGELAYGVGYGIAASVHKNVDLKWEIRVGHAHQTYSQTFVSVNLKIDDILVYFANQIERVGKGTIDVTGKVIKKTIKAPGEVLKWMKKQPKSKDKSSKKTPSTKK